jgi:hypothetical protein
MKPRRPQPQPAKPPLSHPVMHHAHHVRLRAGGSGSAEPMWEEQFLEFDGVGSGRVRVSGDLIEHSEWQQRVQFAFGTDQTCLRPFILALKWVRAGARTRRPDRRLHEIFSPSA